MSGLVRAARFPLLVVVVYLAAWTGLDAISSIYQANSGVSVWYPPTALDFVLLLVFGLRYAPVLLLMGLPHGLFFSSPGQSVWLTIPLDVTTAAVYVVAASVLLRHARIDPRLLTQRDASWFLWVACVGAPLLVAILQVVQLTAAGPLRWSDFATNAIGFWAGTATGVGMLAPVLLILTRRLPRLYPGWHRPPESPLGIAAPARHRLFELTAQALLLLGATWVAYGRQQGGSLDLTYLVYIPLIWIAVRGGFVRVTVALLTANILAVSLVGTAVRASALTLQLGLVSLTLSGLMLGALITQRRADAAQAQHDALHDPLTGLANRTLLLDRLNHAAQRAQRHPEDRLAVLYLDLDHFKSVNDTLGHDAGDELLIEEAQRLQGQVRPGDAVARLGGDEFAILLEEITEVTEAIEVAERLLGALGSPHTIAEHEVVVGASIGITVAEPGQHEPAELLRNADIAMQRAKDQGRNRYQIFSEALHDQAVDAMELRNALRNAVSEELLTLMYQPIYRLPDRRVVGMEALARWTDPERGEIPPSTFIPVAEQAGLIRPLGHHVLAHACDHFARWQADSPVPRRLSVNVSYRQLQDTGFAEEALDILDESGLTADQLSFEVLENVWSEGGVTALATLGQLTAAGIHVVIDDFGTGFSSLAGVRGFAVQGIKIDRSLVAQLVGDVATLAIVEAILAMANALGLEVTAEGVETAAQLEVLQALGCTRAQGHYLHPPVPASQLPGGKQPA